ncbi:hypothetical protein K438DRAFT_2072700 [Mycena galopus ATCC 62051]|nr:hypothetical protein K438DRAFT_2072700 [Mycena galopus ATCC 62051]
MKMYMTCTLFRKAEATPTRSQESFSPAPKPPPMKAALAQQARSRRERETRETRMDVDWFVFGRDFDALGLHQSLERPSLEPISPARQSRAKPRHTWAKVPFNCLCHRMLWAVLTVGDYPIDSASDAAYTKHQKREAGCFPALRTHSKFISDRRLPPRPSPIREVSNNEGNRRTRNAGGRCTTRTAVMLGSINKEDSTFEIAVMQYISATKEHEVFPVCCLISDSPRWQKCNPVPANNELASITHFLTGVELDDDHTVKHFIVDVDKVVFGQSDSA